MRGTEVGEESEVASWAKQGRTGGRFSLRMRKITPSLRGYVRPRSRGVTPGTWEGKDGGAQYKDELSNPRLGALLGRPWVPGRLQEMLQREGGV